MTETARKLLLLCLASCVRFAKVRFRPRSGSDLGVTLTAAISKNQKWRIFAGQSRSNLQQQHITAALDKKASIRRNGLPQLTHDEAFMDTSSIMLF